MGWLSNLFGGKPIDPDQFLVDVDHARQALSGIPWQDCVSLRDGIPAPNWETLGNLLDQREESQQDELWTAVAILWLHDTQVAFGDSYRIWQSQHFLFLSGQEPHAAINSLNRVKSIANQIIAALPGVANNAGYGPSVISYFDDSEDYFRFCDAHSPTHRVPPSGGVFFNHGYGHIAVNATSFEPMEHTVCHELTHAFTRHLPLPLWLNEALAMLMEKHLHGHSMFLLDHDSMDLHMDYWNADTIQGFWRGESFQIDGDPQDLSYHLADILLQHLMASLPSDNKRQRFGDLINNVSWEDAGNQAILEMTGNDLNSLAGRFLGKGDWSVQNPLWNADELL